MIVAYPRQVFKAKISKRIHILEMQDTTEN